MDKKSSASKQKTICEKLLVALRTSAPFRTICFSYSQQHSSSSPTANVCLVTDKPSVRVSKKPVDPLHVTQKTHGKGKVSGGKKSKEKGNVLLPIHGNENRPPKLPEIGHTKSEASESVNRMFSDYINRTKNRFHTAPSIVDTATFKQGSGMKETESSSGDSNM